MMADSYRRACPDTLRTADPAELFLDSDKPNSAIDAFASLLLRSGATAVAIGHALWRTPDGEFAALDLIDASCGISLSAPGRRGR
jgi:hypothetical protein